MKKIGNVILSFVILVGCQAVSKIEVSEQELDLPQVIEESTEKSDEEGLPEEELALLDELPQENLQNLKYIGRIRGEDVYYSTPYYMGSKLIFYTTHPSTLEIEKELELDPDYLKIKMINDKLYVVMREQILIYDNQLELVETRELPDEIKQAVELFGLDMNDELTQFVYSNTEGLWLLDYKKLEPTLLLEPIYYPDGKLMEYSYYYTPTFINEGAEMIVEIGGYEAPAGYVVCEMNNLSCEKVPVAAQATLDDLSHNKKYLMMHVSEDWGWDQRWFDLELTSLVEGELVSFDKKEGEIRGIIDYLQSRNQLILAIGTKNEGQFFPKWIDIECYQIQEDGSLEFIEQLAYTEEVYVDLRGVTPEGHVIYYVEDYDLGFSRGKIYLTQ